MELSTDTAKILVGVGAELAKLAVKGTVTAIMSKIMSIKEEKNVENVRRTYDEIVNGLLQEREDAIRIAQIYKSELDRVEISDDNLQHFHNTIVRVLGIIKTMSIIPNTRENEMPDTFEPIVKELLNADTLKTLQLLGFNYKTAIGEPLTDLCANAIASFTNKQNKNGKNMNNTDANKRK